ncbi:L-serine ammonia-lyase, iron-sulfur-dependent, subunit beta [Paenibacillus albiflavus]|uniref:L-serine deaminase n=1 Tax=Paenibacillus albiflavus TaxID=2545760 RepID=A0A4R4EEA3_9BACL|nr:L-serine ammonia-lyase, iron-sulfur-dependent subunit beta [Paenibacillus albiflavus]TCZ76368.1 L-serine ammonia-lyase, iron-sulfur-dependent, subunit beta [Paenibacillus albiflavus]
MRFKDVFAIIGPAMVGPSSSHTAGAARLGRAARQLLGCQPEQVVITFYGSFAETYKGHCTDLAIVGGILDYDTDDSRLVTSMEDAEKMGIQITFKVGFGNYGHPNTANIVLKHGDKELTMKGASIGGGNIEVSKVDGYDVRFTGNYSTLVITHIDRPGMLAEITGLLQREGVNIGHLSLDRKGRSGEALTVIEIDNPITSKLIQELQEMQQVKEVRTVELMKRG